MPDLTALHRAVSGAPLSPEHRRFKTLLEKIEKARARLEIWHTQLPLFAQMHDEQVAPVIARLQAARREHAFELEQVLLKHKWSKVDRETLGHMICALAGAVLDSAEEPDDELKALYDRHSDVDFDSEGQHHLDELKGMFERMSGVELGDAPVESIEDLMRRAHAQMTEESERLQGGRAHKKPRAAKKTAAQKRAEEAEARISQSVREVYRKLASALHPDRAGDLPPSEREQRTALMQRANSAYEAGDLLALLQLQLQIEQVDLAHVAGVAAEQVKHFNKVLAEQLREIDAEIDERQRAFCGTYGLSTSQRIDPAKLGALMKDEMRELAAAQMRVEHDRRLMRGDAGAIKSFLKRWRDEQRALDMGFF